MRQYVTDAGIASEKAGELVLAVDEACTNCIRHAYGGRTDRTVTIRLNTSEDWIRVCVSDQGKPAPPGAMRKKPLRAPGPGTVEPHGLGVQLIHRAFDKVEVALGAGRGNTITMWKKVDSQ